MKQTALKLAHQSGFFAPFRFLNRHKLLILMYHRFTNEPGSFSTLASDFESHLKYLRQRYRVVSLTDAIQKLTSGDQVEPGTAVITIDDGYRDAYQVALPLLKKYDIPATIFVVTDFMDRKKWIWTDKARFIALHTQARTIEFENGSNVVRREISDRISKLQAASDINLHLKRLADEEKELAIAKFAAAMDVEIPEVPTPEFEALTWDELIEMEQHGVQVGSHTVSHPMLTQVDIERVRRELRDSKVRLENVLGHDVPVFCYPNGATNDQVTEEVRLAGYDCAVTATHGFNELKPDPFKLRRISAEHDLPHFAQNISGFEEFKNSFRTTHEMR